MIKRLLKHATAQRGALLRDNKAHILAHDYAFQIYGANSIYSMVPKNACSTMRLSIAIGNGAIRDDNEANFIHANNHTFKPSLRELMESGYAFIILRCPYSRLASCFLDKFMRESAPVTHYLEVMTEDFRLGATSFKSFCASLIGHNVLRADIHWRPQTDFLVFDSYDDYFCVERLKQAIPIIETKTGLKIVDARNITQHGLDTVELRPADEMHAETTLRQHRRMRRNGQAVHPKSLYDEETREMVKEIFAEDFALFDALFPGCQLFDL